MDKLWAPWRMRYIEKSDEPSCIFCDLPKENTDKENLILHRGEKAFVIMNLYPYNSGHIMVAPYAHKSSLSLLDRDSLMAVSLLTQAAVGKIETLLKPGGINVGMNIGRTAGAGFDEHVHMHIVPRWNGDTNFMPVLGDTKVMSEYLEETYDKMLPLFRQISL